MPVRRNLLAVVLGLGASACPSDDAPPSGGSTDTGPGEATTAANDTEGDTEGEPAPSDASGQTGEPAAWLEAGWGLTDFNAYDGTLPLVVGPQGLAMFSVPLRGQGFHNPPDPGFDNPEVPIVQAWVDVAGYDQDGGHLTAVVDYPALFYPSFEDPEVLEGTAVWLVIPDAVDPAALVGEAAELHVELLDADGLRLQDDHALVIGELPPEPGGP